MKTKQPINYTEYHAAVSMRLAADDTLNPAAVSLFHTLFAMWNASWWAESITTDAKTLLPLCKIKKAETLRQTLELLHMGGYIDVKSKLGNTGGYTISFSNYSDKQLADFRKNTPFYSPENGVFKTLKYPENGVFKTPEKVVFEPESENSNTPKTGQLKNSNTPKTGVLENSNTPKTGVLENSNTPKTGVLENSNTPFSGYSYKEVQTTDNVVKHPTTVQTFVPDGTSAPSAARAEKKEGESKIPEAQTPPQPQAPKEKKVAPKKEKVEPATAHWRALMEEWFRFYAEAHEGNKPRFRKADTAHFKEIIQALERRAIAKDVAWTEEVAVERLRLFLTHAYGRNWLKTHFLLHNLNSQFDAIVNSKPEQQQPSGKGRSGGAVIGAGNPDLERKLADELEQYLPDSRNASHWPD